MLSRDYRLPLRKEWARVKKKSRLWPTPFFGLLVSKQTVIGKPRFGFIVSTRVAKKAVVRNKARRLLQGAILELTPRLQSGWDVVFLAKRKLVGADFREVLSVVEKVFKETALLKEEE